MILKVQNLIKPESQILERVHTFNLITLYFERTIHNFTQFLPSSKQHVFGLRGVQRQFVDIICIETALAFIQVFTKVITNFLKKAY